MTIKRKQRHGRRRYFRRLFSAMLTTCLLGILMTGVISFFLAHQTIEREVVDTQGAMLKQVGLLLDRQYQEMYNMLSMLSSDINLNKAINYDAHILPERLFVYQGIIRSINSVEVSHPSIRAVWLHLNRSNAVIVRSSKYPYDFFVESVLTARERTLFEANVGQDEPFRLLIEQDAQSGEGVFLYTVPLPMNANRPASTACITIRPEVMNDLFEPLVRDEATVLLADAGGQIIFQRHHVKMGEQMLPIMGHLRPDLLEDGWHRINGARYFVMRTYAPASKLSIYAVLPAYRMQQATRNIAQATATVMALSFGIFIVISYIESRRQYKPIRRLLESASGVIKQSPSEQGLTIQDEVRFIESILLDTHESNETLRGLVEHAQGRIATQLVENLLAGQPGDEASLLKELGLIGGVYQALHIETADSTGILTWGMAIEEQFGGLRWRSAVIEKAMAVVVEMDEDHEHPDVLYALAQALHAACAASDAAVTVGIGGTYRQLAGIQLSYGQAAAAARYAHARARYNVIHINEISKEDTGIFTYPAADEQQIINAINAGEGEAAWAILKELIERNIGKNTVIPGAASALYSAIMNTFFRAASDQSVNHAFEQKAVPVSRRAFEERIPELQATCMQLALSARERLRNTNLRLYEQIIAYIETNYAQSISLDVLSDYTGYSASYISHVFKQVSGENYIDYLTRHRIGRAKTLLVDTDLAIADIAMQTGFISHASFSRSFKRIEGIAPGQYRSALVDKK